MYATQLLCIITCFEEAKLFSIPWSCIFTHFVEAKLFPYPGRVCYAATVYIYMLKFKEMFYGSGRFKGQRLC